MWMDYTSYSEAGKGDIITTPGSLSGAGNQDNRQKTVGGETIVEKYLLGPSRNRDGPNVKNTPRRSSRRRTTLRFRRETVSPPRRNRATTPPPRAALIPLEYVLERAVDHAPTEEASGTNGLIYQVHRYGYPSSKDTWKPIYHLPRNVLVGYFNRKLLPLPDESHLRSSQSG